MISLFAQVSGVESVVSNSVSPENQALRENVEHAFSLNESQLIQLDLVQAMPGDRFVTITIGGKNRTLHLTPRSVFAADYQLLVQQPDGSMRESPSFGSCTMRGEIEGEPESHAAASVIDGHLYASIVTAEETIWIEPVGPRLDNAALSDVHVMYRSTDVQRNRPTTCGMTNLASAVSLIDGSDTFQVVGVGSPSTLCRADVACDSDVEYFQKFGSVEAVEAHIQTIINVMNVQYESQVGLHHNISQLIVRPNEPDPYTATDSLELLCELTTEWTENLSHLKRDMTMLFSGHDTGDIVGRASNFGDVCNNEGCCECGIFGTDGSYCYARTEWDSGSFSFATAVTAHELGHLWGAYHCDCSGFTMHYSVPISNSFTSDSVSAIEAYRSTRTCLSCEESTTCVGDFNNDGEINVFDLLHAMEGWGPCLSPCPPSCPNDTDGNCIVNVLDLVQVLNAWGTCPSQPD